MTALGASNPDHLHDQLDTSKSASVESAGAAPTSSGDRVTEPPVARRPARAQGAAPTPAEWNLDDIEVASAGLHSDLHRDDPDAYEKHILATGHNDLNPNDTEFCRRLRGEVEPAAACGGRRPADPVIVMRPGQERPARTVVVEKRAPQTVVVTGVPDGALIFTDTDGKDYYEAPAGYSGLSIYKDGKKWVPLSQARDESLDSRIVLRNYAQQGTGAARSARSATGGAAAASSRQGARRAIASRNSRWASQTARAGAPMGAKKADDDNEEDEDKKKSKAVPLIDAAGKQVTADNFNEKHFCRSCKHGVKAHLGL